MYQQEFSGTDKLEEQNRDDVDNPTPFIPELFHHQVVSVMIGQNNIYSCVRVKFLHTKSAFWDSTLRALFPSMAGIKIFL